MEKLTRDFVSKEPRSYRLKIGRTVASSLTGFIVGVISASIVWMIGVNGLLF